MAHPPEIAAEAETPREPPPEGATLAGKAMVGGAREPLWLTVVAPFSLVVLVAGLYLPAVSNDFIFDDHVLILHERPAAGVGDLLQVFAERHWPDLPYYRPVARFTMVAQKMLHGDAPAPFHAFNAVVMGLVAAAAYELLRWPAFGVRPIAAWLGALLVGAHPIASSCVYPICSGRETLLPALCMLLATVAWLRATGPWQIAALVALGAALLSKEQAIVTPAIFLAADLTRASARPAPAHAAWWIRRYSSVVLLVALYFGVRLVLFGGEEHELAVTKAPILPLLTVMYAVQTTFVPFVPLMYEPLPEHWFYVWRQVVAFGIVAAIVVAAWRAWPSVRNAVLFWLAWIVLVNLPTANILNQEANFDERYELLSLVGVVGIIGGLVSLAWSRSLVRWAATATAVILIVVAGSISYGRAAAFRDDFAFFDAWRHSIPDAEFVRLHLQVAGLETQLGRYERAEAHAREALAVSPELVEARLALAEALLGAERNAEAQAQFDAVLRRAWDDPQALTGLARIDEARGEWSAAAERYRAALRRQPISADAARRYAWLLATCEADEIRDGREAVRWATLVVEADRQEDVAALETLAAAYAEAGDFAQAVRWQQAALRYADPRDAAPLGERLEMYRAQKPYRSGAAR